MMNILITGASGLIGSALVKELNQKHRIYCMHRVNSTMPPNNTPFYWSIKEGIIHFDESIAIDCVIHLAGKNISESRWNAKVKQEIIDSRVQSTQLLVNKLISLKDPPKLFLGASAIGFYGDMVDDQSAADESTSAGTGYLSEVCQQWEQATEPLHKSHTQVVNMRFGVVLAKEGGALAKMLPAFKLGLGGVIGDGKQMFSWISLQDVIKMIRFMIDKSIQDNLFSGAVNIVAPMPVSNAQLTMALGKILKRPTLIPMPSFMVKLLFGEMGESLLLSSSKVLPVKIENVGYRFVHPTLAQALKAILT